MPRITAESFFYGNVPFSPALQQARIEIKLWKAAYTIKTGMKYSSRKFRRLEKKLAFLILFISKSMRLKEMRKPPLRNIG